MQRDDPREGGAFKDIVDWCEGRLDPRRVEELKAQLERSGGGELEHEANWVRAFFRTVRGLHENPLPAEMLQRLLGVFERRNEGGSFRRLETFPPVDTAGDLVLAGLRGSNEEGERHLIFPSDVGDLTIDLYPQPSGLTSLQGQLLTDASLEDVAVAQLVGGEGASQLRTLSPTGEFAYDGLASGEYELVVCTDSFEVTTGAAAVNI